ncbi:RNA polymerase sigma factor [Microlunatus endophyticus]|uniref:RNA polymerase sigma factor n=2 Tax=Microlunatus endophyticus TaxID=1716077 RepID=A0A917W4G3_9ACTN|nr:RNA polymerase sigma factor [Microlunatus endophyticus]
MVVTGSGAALDALMPRIAAGDQEAFATWYDATSAIAYGIVLRVVRNPALAEEVTQEVYVEAWRQATRFDPTRGSSLTWLSTISRRKAVDRVRSTERAARRDERAATVAIDVEDPSDLVVLQDEWRRARSAVDTLSAAQRQAIELVYFSGCTHREVAELLDIPLGTAKARIRDALRQLRRKLEGRST